MTPSQQFILQAYLGNECRASRGSCALKGLWILILCKFGQYVCQQPFYIHVVMEMKFDTLGERRIVYRNAQSKPDLMLFSVRVTPDYKALRCWRTNPVTCNPVHPVLASIQSNWKATISFLRFLSPVSVNRPALWVHFCTWHPILLQMCLCLSALKYAVNKLPWQRIMLGVMSEHSSHVPN